MARPSNWPPRVRRHGKAAVTWWRGREWPCGDWDDAAGGPTPAANAEYGRLVALWAIDPAAVPRDAGDYLVSALCRDYLVSGEVPPARLAPAGRAFELLCAAHGQTPVAEFGPPEFAAFRKSLCAERDKAGTGPRLSRNYVVGVLAFARRAWRWGVAEGSVPAERWQALAAVRNPRSGEARAERLVEPAEAEAVAACLAHLRRPTRAMLELQLLTGARPSELFAMTPAAVHRSGRVRLPGAGPVDLDAEDCWAYVPAEHKTQGKGKCRWLLLSGRAKEVLAPFLGGRAADARCFDPREAAADRTASMRAARIAAGGGSGGNRKVPAASPKSPAKGHYTRHAYAQAVERACAKAGVPKFTPYQVRHLVGHQVDADGGLDDVQATLGHSSAQTSKRYAKRSFGRAARVARERGKPPA